MDTLMDYINNYDFSLKLEVHYGDEQITVPTMDAAMNDLNDQYGFLSSIANRPLQSGIQDYNDFGELVMKVYVA